METVPIFNPQELTSICKILADTSDGLTGTEIAYFLRHCGMPDVSPEMTKWKRLFNAFVEFQNKRQFGNHVVVFINQAMNPVQYTGKPASFNDRRDQLNAVLSFSGMSVRDDGKVRWVKKAVSLDEAMERANRIHSVLVSRQVHQDVLLFCKAELLQKNYFHAIFEAMKSVSKKIKDLSGLDGDGSELVDKAFGFKDAARPVLCINLFSNETQKGELRGFSNLLKGLFGTVRNPLAHDPKIELDMTEQDALDILTTLSLIHRKLDRAYKLKI